MSNITDTNEREAVVEQIYCIKRPPTETVRYFPKRKHTHPTSPRKT